MATSTEQYKKLEKKVIAKITKLILKKGVESEHRNWSVIKLKEDHQFNSEGGRFFTEISSEGLIDNDGHSYSHSVLSLDRLCEIADNL